LEFESTGTQQDVESAVTSYILSKFGVTEEQLSVTVTASSGRRLTASGSVAWQVDFELVADEQAAEQLFETAQSMNQDSSSTAAGLTAAFQGSGLELAEGSVAVAAPSPPLIVTHTVTTNTATTTTTGTTGSFSVTLTTLTSTTGAAYVSLGSSAGGTSAQANTLVVIVPMAGAFVLVALFCCYVKARRGPPKATEVPKVGGQQDGNARSDDDVESPSEVRQQNDNDNVHLNDAEVFADVGQQIWQNNNVPSTARSNISGVSI